MSWYVKEITPEYYTMAMDRWYDAADGNIWISFASADRNKLQVEDYIILKKEHGSQGKPVKEKTRYKILDIKGEAPDFIKSKRQSLGVLYNPAYDDGLVGNEVEGFPLEGRRHIDIPLSTFESTFGDYEAARALDQVDVIIKGGSAADGTWGFAEYSVETFVLQGDENNHDVRMSIEGFFGPEIDFTSTSTPGPYD